MKILIDLTNTPHVLFFRPIIEKLKKAGHTVILTAREYSQTIPMLEFFNYDYYMLGKHAGKLKIKKAINLFERVLDLISFIKRYDPDIIVSHQSPYATLAGFLTGKKTVFIFDNENAFFQNLMSIPFASKILAPETLNKEKMFFRKINHYPGLKESVYLSEIEPDKKVLSGLNIKEGKKIIVVRPEMNTSAYYNVEKDILTPLVEKLTEIYNVILIPRDEKQREHFAKIKDIIIPKNAVDGPSLIYYSDLLLGAGGTMNREAAVLGKKILTTYQEKELEVNKWLIKKGLIEKNINPSIEDIKNLINKEWKKENFVEKGKEARKQLINTIISFEKVKERLNFNVVLTSDIELWSWNKDFEQDIKKGVYELEKLAENEKIPATFFVSLSDKGYNDKNYMKKIEELIKKIKSDYIQFGIHTHCKDIPINFSTESDDLKDYDEDQILNILIWYKNEMERILNKKVIVHRAGSYAIPSLEILNRIFGNTGLKIDSSDVGSEYSKITKFDNLIEIPPSTNKKLSKQLRVLSTEQMSFKEILKFIKKAKGKTNNLVINFHSFSVYGSLGKKAKRIWYFIPKPIKFLLKPLVKKIKESSMQRSDKISDNFLDLKVLISYLKNNGCKFVNLNDLKK
ncbi:hypothetical protein AUJ10_02305 [Candidatus Pacearchaeota archaeon CG1_02_31_27]|nr:MAG: hypothetical protein AUJ10_02305 [Candidatus Pacearchaeota archaeon CG1_02_31_27]PIN92517.1 MAG: hypothetical protein COU55_01800 [Candidatus Pacearchaeota archaeon CG10_big_fil_rev_8_21_14_0_10_31_59]PIZ80832.1 MAG: hypothetical protein COX99_01620 [Candidatus Pacearchaeota archaeon CG_4_10_14_0_2_um_filter_31_10]